MRGKENAVTAQHKEKGGTNFILDKECFERDGDIVSELPVLLLLCFLLVNFPVSPKHLLSIVRALAMC